MSVSMSITFRFRSVSRRRNDVFSRKLCRYVHHDMGVCCIVFDIDGMLFEFFDKILKNAPSLTIFGRIACKQPDY